LIGRKPVNLIVGWCGRFLFFVVPRQFSPAIGEWAENQILIPDWPEGQQKIKIVPTNRQPNLRGSCSGQLSGQWK